MKNSILKNLDKYLNEDWKQFEKDCEYYNKLKSKEKKQIKNGYKVQQ